MNIPVKSMTWKRPSFLCILLIAVYSILSFFRLGSTEVPETFWSGSQPDNTILLDMGKTQELGSILYYLGNDEKREVVLEIRDQKQETWTQLAAFTMERVYHWGRISFQKNGQYLRLTCKNNQLSIGELIIRGKDGTILLPENHEEYQHLFDEQDTFPERFSWQLGTIFDECYFARTANEFLKELPAFEDTHPPLGKILISAGIAAFGMNPFGWRVSGAMAGILLLFVVWRFARRILKDEWLAAAVLALITFDFMHFTESRLGQIDSFLVLFMTGMYYFMYRYYEAVFIYGVSDQKSSARITDSGTWIPETKNGWKHLFGSGVCMGCAIACKWSGCYGAAGLAVIWFAIMWYGFKTSMVTKQYVWKTTLACVLFFVIIPAGIYFVSYIPFRSTDPSLGYWESFIKNQKDILAFHSSQSAFHKQGSSWYQWPVILKPIRLWAAWYPEQRGEFLVLMGNPAFWWIGIILFFSSIADCLERRNGVRLFLITGFLAPIIPWMGIGRSSFLYHYYPSIPFLALLMGVWAREHGTRGKQIMAVCVVLSAILFLLYFPLISGMEVSLEYVERFLQWLPSWEFTKR